MSERSYRAISDALSLLLRSSWPNASTLPEEFEIAQSMSLADFRNRVARLYERIHRHYRGGHFWVKDEHSHFVAVCTNFVAISTLEESILLGGINDTDPRLPWTRQGPLYVRDDREVFATRSPKLNIVERQDREDGDTLWIKTSKVPYLNADGRTGGTVGGFEAITAREAVELSRTS